MAEQTLEQAAIEVYKGLVRRLGTNSVAVADYRRILINHLKLQREVQEANRTLSGSNVIQSRTAPAPGRPTKPFVHPKTLEKAKAAEQKKTAEAVNLSQAPEAPAPPPKKEQATPPQPPSGQSAESAAAGNEPLTDAERDSLKSMRPSEIAATFGPARIDATLDAMGVTDKGKNPNQKAARLLAEANKKNG